MTKSFQGLALGLIALSTLQSCSNGDAVTLKMNFQPGTAYQYELVTKQNISQKMMGQDISMGNAMTFGTTYAVKSSAGTDKVLDVTYDYLGMNMTSTMMSMEYDSRDTSKQDARLKILNGMVGKTFQVTLDEQGNVKKVDGFSSLVNGMVDTASPDAMQQKQLVEGFMNDSSIRQSLQQSFSVYPTKPVKPGDTWKNLMVTNMGPMQMTLDNNYKLISVNNGSAHVEINSTIKAQAATTGQMAQMQGMKIDLTGDQKGTMDIEVASGMVTTSKMTQNIKGKISVQGQEIPMSIKSDVTLTGKKK